MKSKVFTISLLVGIVSFVALNLYSYSKVADPMCSFPVEFGVPFALGVYGGFVTTTHILWGGVIANGVVALCSSCILALIVIKICQLPNKMP